MTSSKDTIKTNTDPDVITVKGTYLKAKSLFGYLLRKWWLILLVSLLGAGIGFYVAYTTKPTYTGTLDFVLSTGTKAGAYSGIASQLGLDIGEQTANDVFSGDNIMTLFRSKRMIKSVLFKTPPGANDILANIIVREYEWNEGWEKNERVKAAFPFPSDTAKLTPVQDSLIRAIRMHLLKQELVISRKDPKLSVYTVSTTSRNELVACYFTRFLMDETANFYIQTKTSTARQSLAMLQRETDSLRGLVSGSITTTAAAADQTFALNPALQVQRAPVQRGQVRTQVLAGVYGEMVKNLQLAKINLQKENPLYQVIDYPELPLEIKKTSKSLAMILGFALGGFVMIMILVMRRIIQSLNS
jgi:hypothetical protein